MLGYCDSHISPLAWVCFADADKASVMSTLDEILGNPLRSIRRATIDENNLIRPSCLGAQAAQENPDRVLLVSYRHHDRHLKSLHQRRFALADMLVRSLSSSMIKLPSNRIVP